MRSASEEISKEAGNSCVAMVLRLISRGWSRWSCHHLAGHWSRGGHETQGDQGVSQTAGAILAMSDGLDELVGIDHASLDKPTAHNQIVHSWFRGVVRGFLVHGRSLFDCFFDRCRLGMIQEMTRLDSETLKSDSRYRASPRGFDGHIFIAGNKISQRQSKNFSKSIQIGRSDPWDGRFFWLSVRNQSGISVRRLVNSETGRKTFGSQSRLFKVRCFRGLLAPDF